MIDERTLVAAMLVDREAYDALAGRLDPCDFGAQAALVVRAIGQFYQRDKNALRVDLEVLKSRVGRSFANHKHAESVLLWLMDLPEEVSAVNVAVEYRQLRRHRVGMDLAAKLAAGTDEEGIDKLVDKYRMLGTDLEGSRQKLSLNELVETVGDAHRLRLVPKALTEAVGGGVLRGHCILVYARPEAGKSMFAINLSAGFLKQGLKVLYAGNEEPIADVQRRFLARMSGTPLSEIQGSLEALHDAGEKAEDNGYTNLIAQELKSGKVAELEALVRKYTPDVLVLDQLKNLKLSASGNRAQELDEAAREVRRLGKQYNMVTVPVTQAGDSASGKLKLGHGDVEWSNTGIPGAADLMIGIGVNDEFERTNRRMINLPKNKISGNHAYFPLFVEPELCTYRSQPRRKD